MAVAAALSSPAMLLGQSYGQLSDPLDPGYDRQDGRSTGAGSSDGSSARSGSDAQQATRGAARTQDSASSDTIVAPDHISGDDASDADTRAPRGRTADTDDANARGTASTGRPAASRPAPPSEFETYVSGVADKPLRRFGAQLLVPNARDFTSAPTTTVPADYRLNPGDELIVGLTGSVQASNLRLLIDSEGKAFIPQVGAVTVGGVRYGDVRAVLARAISRQYRAFDVAVTVGRLHGITVYVTGFAQTPGSYTVSSLSTLINAVLAAGGPSSGGSFRSIQLKRNGKIVSSFDLYDLLLKGDKSADAILHDGDVIYIAPAGAQAAVIGSVNNEAIYEARPDETVEDFLLYAGGVDTVADDARALVLDPLKLDGTGWQEVTPAQARTLAVRRGEVIRVLSGVGIARPLDQQAVLVTVSGEVAHPGRYYLRPGTRLADVLGQAGGLTARAYPFGSVILRDSIRDQQRISFDRALRDLSLQLTAAPLVRASRDNQIQPARADAVQSVIAQLRARKPDGRLLLTIAPTASALPGDLQLENNDTVYVPPRPTTVGVFGAVPSPGAFQYSGTETVGQVLLRAGGVQKLGDRSQIFVVRANGSLITKRHGALGQRTLPGDLIYVPIDGNRGEAWDRIRDLSAVLFQGALAAATAVAVSN